MRCVSIDARAGDERSRELMRIAIIRKSRSITCAWTYTPGAHSATNASAFPTTNADADEHVKRRDGSSRSCYSCQIPINTHDNSNDKQVLRQVEEQNVTEPSRNDGPKERRLHEYGIRN